jgi:rod shape determining protein RodA
MIILGRGLLTVMSAKDAFAANVAGGVFAMIAFHVFINIGMSMGIMPITGIPLFFLSYGGSSLWTALIGVGLLVSIHLRRYRY